MLRILVCFCLLQSVAQAQRMSGFWQGMLYLSSETTDKPRIPVYIDIYVTNGLVDGKMRIENNGGATIYPINGTYSELKMKLYTMKATWYYLPEFALTPSNYSLTYNPKTGYLEGTSDKDSYHLILYKSSGEIAALKAPYLPKEWLVRFQQELKDGLSAPAIRKQELLQFELKPIYFDSDQALIKAEYEDYLREVIRMVKSHSDLRIEITGHTDADGSDAYNMILSRKRSEALIAFLEANGLPKNRVVVRYKGEREPIDSNTTESGKLHNRRIDIRFI